MTLGDKIRSLDDELLTNFILKVMVNTSKLTLRCCGYGKETQNKWSKKSLIDKRDILYKKIVSEVQNDFDSILTKYN